MFIAALFTIAKTCKQLKYPMMDEWIKKKWYFFTMIHYSAIKSNEVPRNATTWLNLEHVMLSERSHSQKIT